MELKRKVAMAVATLAVALGAGHLMQNGLDGQPEKLASAAPKTPQAITPLAAGVGPSAEPITLRPESESIVLPDTAFSPDPAAMPEQQATVPQPATPELDGSAEAAPSVALSGDSTNCPVTLEVIAAAQATLDLTLIAPCRASERVVLRHGGLAITAMTSLTGTLFTSLPGLESGGEVSVYFNDGLEAVAAESLPDLPLYRRFAVQWVADDNFQLHAYENGATFGEEGHVSAANPQRRLPNVQMKGGYLSLLGDSTAPLPMLAEVYTFPLDPANQVDLAIEAAVTTTSCDRELLGEVLFSEGGTLTKTDLTMATPTCDAIGDVLVLNNPLPDLKLAAAN